MIPFLAVLGAGLMLALFGCEKGVSSEEKPTFYDDVNTAANIIEITANTETTLAGEEAVWQNGVPVWSMNYAGKVTDESFSGDFLKEALKHVIIENPYRGPEYYEEGS